MQRATPRVLCGNRLEQLVEALAERLRQSPLPPLCAETIVVPGQGMARWVTLELARHLGIAAALELPFPGAFLAGLCARADPTAAGTAVDRAFARPALELRLFRLLGDAKLQKELGAAGQYCVGDPDQRRRLQLAQRLAACFDDYQLYRDDVLLQWQRGDGPDLPHASWQRGLWQELLREVGALPAAPTSRRDRAQGLLFGADAPTQPAPGAHRLERLRRLLADPAAARLVLPPRVTVFGLATLPPAFLDLLHAMAAHVEVVVYAPKATPHLFSDVRRDRSGRAPQRGSGHPLLAAWGRQSREFFDLLLDRSPDGDVEEAIGFATSSAGTLLHTLQRDLEALCVRGDGGDAPPLPLGADDESVRVHSVHGPLREMQVLRDQILHAMERDPTLSPSDVLVLLPDVAAYAPYVHAVFRPLQPLLPFHVADRSPAVDLPLPAVLLRLCALARGRFTAPEVLLLLEEPALARRFHIARPELLSLRAWVHRTRIRWGLDGEQRQRDFGLPADDANSWRQGIDRLVLGVATGRVDAPVLGLLPAGDSTSSRIELLGRFCTFVDAIAGACQALARPHTLAVWADVVERLIDELFLAVGDDELQGLHHLHAAARQLRELQDLARVAEELSPVAFASWLENALATVGENRGFLTGAITFAALRPMRTVPARMLCIAGLGDGAFPRRDQRAVFDLLESERRQGDRNARDDDRQLFLDAVLAARDRLVLSWVGRSQKDNSECAPSPVLGELLDHLDRAFTVDRGTVRERIVVEHPLQSFSPRYGGKDGRLFTYGARVTTAAPAAPPATPLQRPAAPATPVLELRDLVSFWRHPTRWYCQRVLDVRFLEDDDRDDDAEPFRVHSLDKYNLEDAAVTARLSGAPDALADGTALQSGLLPPGPLGRVAHRQLEIETARFCARIAALRATGRAQCSVQGSDYVVRADLVGLAADALVLWRPAILKAKDRLRALLHHVFLCAAAQQGQPLPSQTRLISLGGELQAPSFMPALPVLDQIVAGFRSGQAAPLPFFEHASWAYVAAIDGNRSADQNAARQQARKAFLPAPSDNDWQHDLPDPFVELCYRDRDPIESPEFAEWAMRLFDPARSYFQESAS